jgi:hypothetical protein
VIEGLGYLAGVLVCWAVLRAVREREYFESPAGVPFRLRPPVAAEEAIARPSLLFRSGKVLVESWSPADGWAVCVVDPLVVMRHFRRRGAGSIRVLMFRRGARGWRVLRGS